MESNPNPNEALVLFERTDQLGARIEGLLSAWRFARVTRRKLVVFWADRKPAGVYDPALVFDVEAMAQTDAASDLVIRYAAYQEQFAPGEAMDLRTARGWPFFLRKKNYLQARERPVKIVTDHSTYFCFFGESPWRVSRELRALFPLLTPAKPVREALEAALAWIGDPDFIAVHIRRGDVVRKLGTILQKFIAATPEHGNSPEAFAKLRKEGELDAYIKYFVKRVTPIAAYLAALPEGKKPLVLIFSDTPEAAREFQAGLKDEGTRSLLMSAFQAELAPAQRVFLELLVLSKASRVVSTASCFSRLACQCGRPRFSDARNTLGRKGAKRAFGELYGELLKDSEFLRVECERLLDRELMADRLVRMPDWLVRLVPALTWISMR